MIWPVYYTHRPATRDRTAGNKPAASLYSGYPGPIIRADAPVSETRCFAGRRPAPPTPNWRFSMKFYALLSCAIGVGLIATSCSTGPRPPEPGTPAFFWGAAQQVFKAGDLRKTSDDLLEILGTENEFTGKARVWEIALAAGMVKGSEDLAQGYESGAKMNRQN